MSDFPAMRWNPETGEPKVCRSAAEVPEGWLTYHPQDPARAAKSGKAPPAAPAAPAPVVVPVKPVEAPVEHIEGATRAEIEAALKERGVAYSAEDTLAQLYERLLKEFEKEF